MSGIEAIAAERKRQIEAEGWSQKHDDAHTDGSLAVAAACYAASADVIFNYPDSVPANDHKRLVWPWDRCWWKPKDQRRNLVRAGALIAAEIDRIDRAAGRS